MTKRKNSPQKNLQEITTANELIKKDLNNITESEFRIIVIKLIAGLENSIQDSRESLATEIKGLRNSHEELKNALNEMHNKMETTTARLEEAEERIGELEDKVMEKEEAEKKSLTAAPPTNSSYTPQHRGRALQVLTTPGTIQNDQAEEFPSEESPGNNNS